VIAGLMSVVGLLSLSGCRSERSSSTNAASIPRGGELVASIRTEPRSLNRFAANDTSTDLVAMLTQAKLVRINRVTDEVEPWLAGRWTRSNDGLQYTVTLRANVAFSDGHPFSSDDVAFSMEAAYTAPLASGALQVGGKRLIAATPDPLTVVFTFPQPFAPGMRIFDNLPILPRHKLEAALKAGTFLDTWGLATPPSEMTGLGPFVLASYAPGQRFAFDRNPHYWRRDASGASLPYLDRITLEVVPDEGAELLHLQSGQSDMTISEIPADAYASVKRAADAGMLKLWDLGVGYDPDALWFNLKPGAFAGDARAAWLQRDELRRAISMAIDRQAFADTVFLGAGVAVWGPITPANKKWYAAGSPRAPYDAAGAKKLLASIGLIDRDGDGTLEDARGGPARFSLVTQKGRPSLERGASVVRDDLAKIGVIVDVVALDGTAVIQQIMSSKYEAVYFHPILSDTDPANSPDFWLSSGSLHFWNIGQKTPATEWEKRIDDLMGRQIRSQDEAERKRLFDEVQAVFAEHAPALYFVAPRIFAASSTRVTNVTPAVRRPQLLWAPDEVAVR
jgi:peptide/nickel transport system substrate-binding protein